MFKRKTTFLGTVLGSLVVASCFAGCNSGDTDGGQGNDDAGPGTIVVSDGGFGASLTIDVASETIPTAGRVDFGVTALDPRGAPLVDRRVFCESEHGIAIIEPSHGGVAFEHTGSQGRMSGVLGGLTPGSFMIECRLEEGFNLVARKHIKVVGEVPAGFNGFPGAAGGNLGGGVLVENPNADDISALQVQFLANSGSTATSNGPIDITRITDCDGDGAAEGGADTEPFFFDQYVVSLSNALEQPLTVESIEFTVDLPGGDVDSSTQRPGLVIAANSEATITGTFTEFISGTSTKVFAGTDSVVPTGTYNVTFTVRGETASGEGVRLSTTASVTFGSVNNCS